MKKLDIVYEDKYILVINKPAHLLTVSTDKEREHTLYHEVYEYLRKKNQKVFIVHRLDKETSGLIVFAKDPNSKTILQDEWENNTRIYHCIVEGKVEKESDVIKSYLKENSNFISFSSKDGKLAITEYKRLNYNKEYSLLEINIITGRKNQIRVHMSEMGNPIMGDKKYNSKTNYLKRLALQASILELKHPKTKEIMHFEIKIPNEFLKMFKAN